MCTALLSASRHVVSHNDMRMKGVSLTASIPEVVIAGEQAVERPVMERFVAAEFLAQYSANVKTFMPWLLGLSCGEQLGGGAGCARQRMAHCLSSNTWIAVSRMKWRYIPACR